jgi:hypothetical protein
LSNWAWLSPAWAIVVVGSPTGRWKPTLVNPTTVGSLAITLVEPSCCVSENVVAHGELKLTIFSFKNAVGL